VPVTVCCAQCCCRVALLWGPAIILGPLLSIVSSLLAFDMWHGFGAAVGCVLGRACWLYMCRLNVLLRLGTAIFAVCK
jgi:threonine/homoserine/homoserine lactone efflux protein